ncbi:hypothetical protein HK405_008166 [Cladochytrium tenue]|nr:hypothetical protein HK405_008166 [Cladochytrium tenue]
MVLAAALDPRDLPPRFGVDAVAALLGRNRSVWTIDLAYLLKAFGVDDFTYYTSHVGVNWQFSQSVPFYRDSLGSSSQRRASLTPSAPHLLSPDRLPARTNSGGSGAGIASTRSTPSGSPSRLHSLHAPQPPTSAGGSGAYPSYALICAAATSDPQRVHQLFAAAGAAGVRVVSTVLPLDDIRRFLLSGRYAVILLVDLNRLKCIPCARRAATRAFYTRIFRPAKQAASSPVPAAPAGVATVRRHSLHSASDFAPQRSPLATSPARPLSYLPHLAADMSPGRRSVSAAADPTRVPVAHPTPISSTTPTAPLTPTQTPPPPASSALHRLFTACCVSARKPVAASPPPPLATTPIVTACDAFTTTPAPDPAVAARPALGTVKSAAPSPDDDTITAATAAAGSASAAPTSPGVVAYSLAGASWAARRAAGVVSSGMAALVRLGGSATEVPATEPDAEAAVAAASNESTASLHNTAITTAPDTLVSSTSPPLASSSTDSAVTVASDAAGWAWSLFSGAAAAVASAFVPADPERQPLLHHDHQPSSRSPAAASSPAALDPLRTAVAAAPTASQLGSGGGPDGVNANDAADGSDDEEDDDDDDGFAGHYVLLVGYDVARDRVWFRDPGSLEPLCVAAAADLDAARAAFGTDCDAIVVRAVPAGA